MRLRILGFAGVREIVGTELELELPDGSTWKELRDVLERRFPELEQYWDRLAVAVDGSLGEPKGPLADGSEIALLPPVSGGGDGPAVELTHDPIAVDRIAQRASHPGAGAVLTFQGTVRDRHRNRSVTHLTYEAYEPLALQALARIAAELEAGREQLAVAIAHRLGDVSVGETSVVIAVSSPHREVAYDASREALERLKREVPIWKREHYSDGESEWREEEPLKS